MQLNKTLIVILLFHFGLILCSCKQNDVPSAKVKELEIKSDSSKDSSTIVKNDSSYVNTEIRFDIIHAFKQDESESSYVSFDTNTNYVYKIV